MNNILHETAQKLRGGYYTPPDLAAFIAAWVLAKGAMRILEPSAGDGAFIKALVDGGLPEGACLNAFELDGAEAAKARKKLGKHRKGPSSVNAVDFLGWALNNWDGEKFDAVVGNPPFIRYQYLPKPFQIKSEMIFHNLNLKFTKHTNAWVPFVMASISLLRPGGRLGMVLPSEIIHVLHAQSLRSFMGVECSRITIIDPEELWFDGTLQGAVILLAEKKEKSNQKIEGLGIYPVKGRKFAAEDAESIFKYPKAINGKTVEGKWTRALLTPHMRNIFDSVSQIENVHKFGDIANVDVGIVTGANEFFLVSEQTVEENKLLNWARPAFGRSGHCPGIIYDKKQHNLNEQNGLPSSMLIFEGGDVEKYESVKSYIAKGEKNDFHKRYKCRIRPHWYSLQSISVSEIGMLKRSHGAPRLILNKIGALTTDTSYRIRSEHFSANKLVGCFLNPYTALSAELEGRSYGGGVLELVPSEIEKLLVPVPRNLKPKLGEIDRLLKSENMDAVMVMQSEVVLGSLGLDCETQSSIFSAWKSLRDRRNRVSN